MKKICKNCLYVKIYGKESINAECRRHAPVGNWEWHNKTGHSWPIIELNDWCGEFIQNNNQVISLIKSPEDKLNRLEKEVIRLRKKVASLIVDLNPRLEEAEERIKYLEHTEYYRR